MEQDLVQRLRDRVKELQFGVEEQRRQWQVEVDEARADARAKEREVEGVAQHVSFLSLHLSLLLIGFQVRRLRSEMKRVVDQMQAMMKQQDDLEEEVEKWKQEAESLAMKLEATRREVGHDIIRILRYTSSGPPSVSFNVRRMRVRRWKQDGGFSRRRLMDKGTQWTP